MTSKTSNSHPFLDPLWRRIVFVAAIAAWSLTEFYFEVLHLGHDGGGVRGLWRLDVSLQLRSEAS